MEHDELFKLAVLTASSLQKDQINPNHPDFSNYVRNAYRVLSKLNQELDQPEEARQGSVGL